MKTIRCKGANLYPWQSDVIKGVLKSPPSSIHCVKSKRQLGKSILCQNLLLYFCLNHSNSTSAYLAPVLSQSRKCYKDLIKAARDTGVIARKNDSLLELEFINGSNIVFLSAEQGDHIRGNTVKDGVLVIDESCYITDSIFDIAFPLVDVHRCPIVMVSTPRFRTGRFYNLFCMGEQGTSKTTFSYDWAKYDTSALLSKEKLEEYRKIIPSIQFRMDYLGEFVEGEGSVFTNFKECTYESISPSNKIWIGVDWGSGNGQDYTSISAINERGEQVMCEYFNNLSTTQQIDKIASLLSPYSKCIQKIVPELNSIGSPMTELLKEKMPGINIQGETTTNESKLEMVSDLQVAFEQKNIKLLPDDLQLNELSSYEATFNPRTKNISYNAPAGLHDDAIIALMYSWKAFKNSSISGSYELSFGNRHRKREREFGHLKYK